MPAVPCADAVRKPAVKCPANRQPQAEIVIVSGFEGCGRGIARGVCGAQAMAGEVAQRSLRNFIVGQTPAIVIEGLQGHRGIQDPRDGSAFSSALCSGETDCHGKYSGLRFRARQTLWEDA
jgi:hypothetical protein